MTDRQKYEIYTKMFDRAMEFRIEIEEHLKLHVYPIVYSVFVSVEDEEKGLYFVDVEVGGENEKYKHVRGMFTEEQIKEKFF